MGKKKYYAVKIGNNPGIYETWAECEAQVKGFSGAVYKSFATCDEAEAFMIGDIESIENQKNSVEGINNDVEQRLTELKSDEVVAFVDGSYNETAEKAGFGVIIIDDKGIQTQLYKAIGKQFSPEFLELRNVAAELEGVKEAIMWAVSYAKKRIDIYYDYEGIGKWADGSWKAKKELTRQYVTFIKEKKALININFVKVPAHAGIEYNEMADTLAKNSILEKGYKAYDNGSVYFVGFSGKDWETIIDCINEENKELTTEKAANVINIVKDNGVVGNKERFIVTSGKSRVVINCYQNCKSYVQGKQTVLLQKIISLAIELMGNEQTVIETLNKIHVLTVSQDEVENKFESLLPHYNGIRNGKFYNNLLAAVYNTMLTGYMPDYTSLITPIFRSFEYYLHRILGDKMGLNTCDNNGNNKFGYFQKNGSGRYECSSKDIAKLNTQQIDFLNDLYNEYHNIRHPYTHWSFEDFDTAVMTSIDTAKNYLYDGLTLIDKYYILF